MSREHHETTADTPCNADRILHAGAARAALGQIPGRTCKGRTSRTVLVQLLQAVLPSCMCFIVYFAKALAEGRRRSVAR